MKNLFVFELLKILMELMRFLPPGFRQWTHFLH